MLLPRTHEGSGNITTSIVYVILHSFIHKFPKLHKICALHYFKLYIRIMYAKISFKTKKKHFFKPLYEYFIRLSSHRVVTI